MKLLKSFKLFENLKVKNITEDDIINAIKSGGWVWATIINNLPNNDPDEELKPVSIDEDGLVTILYKGSEYEVDLKNIEKVDFIIKESLENQENQDRSKWSSNYWRSHLRKLKSELRSQFEITYKCYGIIGEYQNNTLEELYEIEDNIIKSLEFKRDYLDVKLQDLQDKCDVDFDLHCSKPFGVFTDDDHDDCKVELYAHDRILKSEEILKYDSIWYLKFKGSSSINRVISADEFIKFIEKLGKVNYLKVNTSTSMATDDFEIVLEFKI